MDENTILTLAKSTLLTKEEVQMWVDHLSCLAKHRQARAKKAAKSRAKKGTQFKSLKYHDSKYHTAKTRATLSSEYCHCYTTNVDFMFLHFTAQPKLYCFCQKTDDGSQAMIAFDNPSCKFEWFHFQIVGLQEEEDLVGEWFCPSCTLAP